MSYHVYILQLNNSKRYTGSCSNISRRVAEHQRGRVKSTKSLLPIKLLLVETYLCKSDAQRREKFLKTTEGKRLLKQQIRDTLEITSSNGEVA